MRLAFGNHRGSFAPCAFICAALALMTLSTGATAQQSVLAESATLTESADAGSAILASSLPAAVASPETTADATIDSTLSGAGTLSMAGAGSSANEFSLDDQMLSRQRGGAVGMLMVAATPQLMRGSGSSNVTLWDEIAPPSPLPIPVDAARAAQGNVASYQRK